MKKVIVDRQYKLAEFPSVPYTPRNFWETMQRMEGIEVIVGKEPPDPRKSERQQSPYRGTFYFHGQVVAIKYEFDYMLREATVTLYGLDAMIDETERVIREEHKKR